MQALVGGALALGVQIGQTLLPPNAWFITPGCLPDSQRRGVTELWCPGDAGYMCYKIPTLLRVPRSSTLLGFIEARKFSCNDHGFVDLLVRRSDDGGDTSSSAC